MKILYCAAMLPIDFDSNSCYAHPNESEVYIYTPEEKADLMVYWVDCYIFFVRNWAAPKLFDIWFYLLSTLLLILTIGGSIGSMFCGNSLI